MRCIVSCLIVSAVVLAGCAGKKTASTTTQQPVKKVGISDSIDRVVDGYEQRLDVKMKRKKYEPQPGTLITLQKWFEYGDTTRLLKLREEVLTDSRMDIVQYHFIGGKLAEIHTYTYNKKCGGNKKECMDEAKFYFDNEVVMARKRHAEGTSEHTPAIESVAFAPFQPKKTTLADQRDKIIRINAKYASLPYPTRRPEKGTPVSPQYTR